MDKPIQLCFGTNIRKYRTKRKLTQQRLAEMAGIEYKYIQRIEGKNPPAVRIDTVERIAKALKVKSFQLIK